MTIDQSPFNQSDRQKRQAASLCRTLAPEEIRAGQYVTVIESICELPSFFWCADTALHPPERMVRLRYLPRRGGVPLRVRALSLPYVLVKRPDGTASVLDVRRQSLARLSPAYARAAWKLLKRQARRMRRR